MAMENTFRDLLRQLKKLNDSLEPLRCLLPEDPMNVELALVQHLRESVEGASGWIEDCLAQVQAAQDGLNTCDLNRTKRALAGCQASFDEAERTFSAELLSYDKLREVVSLGARRKDVWLIWSQSVKRDLEVCGYELDLTRKALTACWQELAEQAVTTNVAVRANSAGTQITMRTPQFGELDIEGVT